MLNAQFTNAAVCTAIRSYDFARHDFKGVAPKTLSRCLDALFEHYNAKTGIAFPSIARIAALAKVSTRTVDRAIALAANLGLIVIGKRPVFNERRTMNEYSLGSELLEHVLKIAKAYSEAKAVKLLEAAQSEQHQQQAPNELHSAANEALDATQQVISVATTEQPKAEVKRQVNRVQAKAKKLTSLALEAQPKDSYKVTRLAYEYLQSINELTHVVLDKRLPPIVTLLLKKLKANADLSSTDLEVLAQFGFAEVSL